MNQHMTWKCQDPGCKHVNHDLADMIPEPIHVYCDRCLRKHVITPQVVTLLTGMQVEPFTPLDVQFLLYVDWIEKPEGAFKVYEFATAARALAFIGQLKHNPRYSTHNIAEKGKQISQRQLEEQAAPAFLFFGNQARSKNHGPADRALLVLLRRIDEALEAKMERDGRLPNSLVSAHSGVQSILEGAVGHNYGNRGLSKELVPAALNIVQDFSLGIQWKVNQKGNLLCALDEETVFYCNAQPNYQAYYEEPK